jgi:hypothetical protein
MQLTTLGHRRAPKQFRRRRLTPPATTLAVSAAIVIAGCGGSSTTTSTRSTTSGASSRSISADATAGGSSPGSASLQADTLRFSKCMRSHGVTNFPDPSSDGQLTIKGTGINIHTPAFSNAQNACQSLMPAGATPGPSGQKSDVSAAQGLALAKCMRAHGVSNFPDPDASGAINPSSVNLSSPQVQNAFHACQSATGAPSAP